MGADKFRLYDGTLICMVALTQKKLIRNLVFSLTPLGTN